MTRRPSGKPVPLAPETLPKLIILRSEARQKLEAHIEKGRELINRPITSQVEMDASEAGGEKWRDFAIRLLSTFFDTMLVAEDYQTKTRRVSISLRELHFTEKKDSFKQRMSSRINELESIMESLELFAESPMIANHQCEEYSNNSFLKDSRIGALEKVELIANRFHIVARQLKQRHNDRSAFAIADEYDVQDLFHALLRLYFDDIRNEEWTPSYAGGTSRIDFLLKAEQIVIELKMTRQGMSARDVSNQLIIDTDRYQVHPDCKTLIAFVYDPQEYLNNPRGIENDLTRSVNSVPVRVIINPR